MILRPLLLVLALSLTGQALFAQASVIQEVGQALRRGDAAAVAAHFDQTVVIELLGKETMTNKARAQEMLAAFFRDHPPSGFRQSHSGTSQGKDSHYVIGDLNDAKGKFRVYLFFKTSGGKYALQELRIDQ